MSIFGAVVARWMLALLLVASLSVKTFSAEPVPSSPASAEEGWKVLRSHPLLPADFDEEVFEQLWTVWPEPDRSAAEAAAPAARRKLMFEYYGLVPKPDDPECRGIPLGYISDGRQGWVMTCLACHGGSVAGQVIPGLGNSHYALQTLTEDVRLVKLRLKKTLTHMDLGSLKIPLNLTDGTTNSVIFGVLLGALRRPDMSVVLSRPVIHVENHDVDAPPYWNVKKKSSLYADGFAPKTHRPLMQFMLIPRNTQEIVYGWENDFRNILAWIESVEAPRYPWDIDENQAARGRQVFETNCARCHGSYGPGGKYEQQTVAIDDIGTDRLRLDALTVEHRQWMKVGWMSNYGKDPVVVAPGGYVAPPLDGLWASAPYFHNGSVPTLWHVLHPQDRPKIWKRTRDGYDRSRVGLEITEFPEIPEDAVAPAQRRRYFNTALPGKSSAGHTYPDELTEEEKASLLEYLKTL